MWKDCTLPLPQPLCTFDADGWLVDDGNGVLTVVGGWAANGGGWALVVALVPRPCPTPPYDPFYISYFRKQWSTNRNLECIEVDIKI